MKFNNSGKQYLISLKRLREMTMKREKVRNYCGFGEVFKNIKGKCETMSACCSGPDGSNEFGATMENMMTQGKMEACCGPKSERKTGCSK